ncbi:Putative ADP-ribose 1''-phosphate phosphatase [Komagataella phaffii CBS 7435]|uniref:Macro domain-containing protein n=2 Tax=Komagataella phaffii TaxID=460519 RepID=C4QWE3_KOMPG|nr:uncharacterized protein PAS_chr1-1_0482 [Komagataella phaffii GS115]AOA60446.1 GQ67_02779T0 [Komagataella phaffii]CAH2446236.1 Putative ADP-ribose 1''-phosphate phosphatase [Komagataella phaffii CBS 7435]AOA65981.1 GQ68_02469T0 [Komagataella phaffii GS115]CAY67566.1 hypothetical protein PAS_chr1-1_0482 [Komagataella phaffii GS115]CCA36662.1 Putative ADP-ribose 1''-phosphate phosphatase [Komagataella phaffii CBS 7435]
MLQKIILLDLNKELCSLWQKEIQRISNLHPNNGIPFQVFNGTFDQLRLDSPTTIVSPGNSFASFGGGIDVAIRELLQTDPGSLEPSFEECVAGALIKCNGYIPVQHLNNITFSHATRGWRQLQCDTVVHIPTMRVPRHVYDGNEVHWKRFIFDIVWKALNEVKTPNVIFPGLATGFGGLPVDLVAESMISSMVLHQHQGWNMRDRGVHVLKYLAEDPSFLEL